MSNNRPAGDILDDIFTELDDIKAQLVPYEAEERAINFTKTGRLRLRLNEKQARRLAEIEDETRELRRRYAALTKQACQTVARATDPETRPSTTLAKER